MKIECDACKEEYDLDSDDIIYCVTAEGQFNIIHGFVCRKCKVGTPKHHGNGR